VSYVRAEALEGLLPFVAAAFYFFILEIVTARVLRAVATFDQILLRHEATNKTLAAGPYNDSFAKPPM
jgi:hypothetical protein